MSKQQEEQQYLDYIKKQNQKSIDIYIEEIEKKIRQNNLLLKKIEYMIEKYK